MSHGRADGATTALEPSAPQSRALVHLVVRTRLIEPDARSAPVLRSVGLPLIVAAVVATGAQSARAAAGAGGPTDTASTLRASVPTTAASVHRRQASRRAPGAQAESAVVTYTVRPGDTVWDLAQRTGTSVEAILAANQLNRRGLIHPGQVLILPALRPSSRPPARSPRRPPVVYTVRRGDSVSAIAQRFRITVTSILAANRLGPDALIYPGRKLVLPGARPTSALKAAPPTHIYLVKQGDTLSGIANQAKVRLRQLLTLNQLDPATVIYPGQKLLVPGPAPVPDTFLGRTYPPAVAQAAAANRAALARRAVPSRARVQALIASTARRLGVDPRLAQAIAYQESGFDQHQVSPANAIGAMQVIPSTGAWASSLVGRHLDLLDTRDNVTAGVVVLAALVATAPDEPRAIAGYYQGLRSVLELGMYPDTRRYVANVQTLMSRFR